MKRGTPKHPKVFMLMQEIGCDRPTAIGYLELLWHFTAEYAPRGDIGKFSDEIIEAALYWTGRGKAKGKLIKALTKCGWCDESHEMADDRREMATDRREMRIIVHDWSDHADDAVRKRLHRSNQQFARKVTGQRRTNAGQNPVSDRKLSDFVRPRARALPVPEPVPVPSPPVTAVASSGGVVDLEAVHTHTTRAREFSEPNSNGNGPPFSEFSERYPRHLYERESARIWKRKVTTESLPSFRACLENYLESDEVSRNVVMNGPKWLEVASASDWQIRWPKPKAKSILAPEEEILKLMKADKEEHGKH